MVGADACAPGQPQFVVEAGEFAGAWAGARWKTWPLAPCFLRAREAFCVLGRELGRDLVREAAADEADGGVDGVREPGGERVDEVVGVDASVEPCEGQGFERAAGGGGKGDAAVPAAEFGEREVGGEGRWP